MKLKRLRKRRNRRRRARARQYRKWKKTSDRGHLRAFRRHDKAVKKLNRLIEQETERRQLLKVYSREEWGAADPHGSYVRQRSLKAGVQHHTAMPTLSTNASVEEECARMRQLQAIHLGQGWTDIGYALVCFPSGRIYEGRPAEYVGAHTLNHNTRFAGWALDGNYEEDEPTTQALLACRRCREILGVADKPLFGHCDLSATACPGKHLKPHLNKEI